MLGLTFILLRSVGNVAPVEWIVTNASSSKYSGIFKTGGRFGFLRASTAAEAEPDKTDCDPQCAFIPGMSLKMMRDNVPSGNLFGMVALIGQNSFNFFANNMTVRSATIHRCRFSLLQSITLSFFTLKQLLRSCLFSLLFVNFVFFRTILLWPAATLLDLSSSST